MLSVYVGGSKGSTFSKIHGSMGCQTVTQEITNVNFLKEKHQKHLESLQNKLMEVIGSLMHLFVRAQLGIQHNFILEWHFS